MGDQSKGEHASYTKQNVKTKRDDVELSSDSSPDDTIKTKDVTNISTKSDSKLSLPVRSLRQLTANGEGHGKHMQVNRPGKPFVKCVSWDSVDIEWDAVTSFCNGDVYQVRCENIGSRKWKCQNFEINRGKITSLQLDTSYIFSVRLVKSNGEISKFGETSKEVRTQLEVKKPGKPVVKCVSWDSVDIEWDAVTRFCNGDVYQVRCENIGSRKWNWQKFEINSGKITSLQPGNSYIFSVRVVKSNGEESQYGETSKEVLTQLEINRPGKPFVKCISWDSVDIEWDAVASFCNGDVYEVRWENIKSRKWECQNFEINSCKITSLQPGTTYSFKVRLVKSEGEEGNYGETSEVTTKKEPIPGKPSVLRVFADRVTLKWEQVDTFCKGDVYEVHAENIHTKKNSCQRFDQNCATIGDLQPGSPYVFKVRLVRQNGQVFKYSENSDTVKTCSTFASKLVGSRSPVETSNNGTALYELPLAEVKHATNADAGSIKYQIGKY